MKQCKKCGTQVTDEMEFCQECVGRKPAEIRKGKWIGILITVLGLAAMGLFVILGIAVERPAPPINAVEEQFNPAETYQGDIKGADDFVDDPYHQGEFEQSLDSFGEDLQEENDIGNYSTTDEDIWEYCEERWDYYDNLEGTYSGDKYTDQVFADAASKFGISANAAYLTWQNVEQKKLGI